MSISRHAVGAVNGKNFMNPVSIEGQGELNSQGIDLNASAKLVFEDGSIAEVKSATNLSSASDVEISDGENTIIINQPWHCGEFTNRKSQIILKKRNGDEELIDITTDKGLYSLEIDHFSENLRNKNTESCLIPHNDSSNMIALDTWRKALKVVYDEDRGERRQLAIISQTLQENLCLLLAYRD